jgi:hypothetical protein
MVPIEESFVIAEYAYSVGSLDRVSIATHVYRLIIEIAVLPADSIRVLLTVLSSLVAPASTRHCASSVRSSPRCASA